MLTLKFLKLKNRFLGMSSQQSDLPVLSDAKIHKVFNEFDTDESGDISIDEFVIGVKKLKLPLSNKDISHLVSIVDTNKDGKISFDEFEIFTKKQDEKIRATFSSLDINKDQTLSPTEVRSALESQLGLELSNEELHNFIKQFSDKDKNQNILFSEFRQKVLLLPAINTRYIYDIMRPTLSIDIGEDFTIPADNQDVIKQAPYSRANTFISGGICGALSRTATAPVDRVKMLFQSGALGKDAKMFEIASNILNEGGIKSFWRGNGANGLKIAPESAVKFMSYDVLKKYTCQYPDNPRMYERFIAGGLGMFFHYSLHSNPLYWILSWNDGTDCSLSIGNCENQISIVIDWRIQGNI